MVEILLVDGDRKGIKKLIFFDSGDFTIEKFFEKILAIDSGVGSFGIDGFGFRVRDKVTNDFALHGWHASRSSGVRSGNWRLVILRPNPIILKHKYIIAQVLV